MSKMNHREEDLDYAILGLLNHENMTGYNLKKFLGVQLGFFWDKSSYGKIYRVLERLERQELIKGTPVESEKKKRTIVTLYEITEPGRRRLSEWVQVPIEQEISLDHYTIGGPNGSNIRFKGGNLLKYLSYFLLKFYFGANTTVDTNLRQLANFEEKFVDRLKQVLEVVVHQLEQLSTSSQEKNDHLYYLLTAKFGLQMCKAFSEWKLSTQQQLIDIQKRGTQNE
ncbi:MAG: helix-turn-helix transcriptional regulator [Candidatus Heimdallarchaeota archaeon]